MKFKAISNCLLSDVTIQENVQSTYSRLSSDMPPIGGVAQGASKSNFFHRVSHLAYYDLPTHSAT